MQIRNLVLPVIGASILTVPAFAQQPNNTESPPSEAAVAPAPKMTAEQQAQYDLWPVDQQTQFAQWPADIQTYYWALPEDRQFIFWQLADSGQGRRGSIAR